MSYTITQFNKQYPNDDVCLDEIFNNRYGDLKCCPDCGVVGAKFYRIKKRKCYACMWCGYQINPLAGTIFHKSATPLKSWFFAMYLFSVSKNGVSAKELERALGVTYKCAHRIAQRIRMLMQQGSSPLDGIVEADETYVGGKRHRHDVRGDNKTAVIGLAQRKGEARAIVADANASVVVPFVVSNLDPSAKLHTDESKLYYRVSRYLAHESINHAKREYARGNVTTNTIEGFWSQLKRSIDGTYHCVSPKYLQLYVDEFAYRYNHRTLPALFPALVEAAARPV